MRKLAAFLVFMTVWIGCSKESENIRQAVFTQLDGGIAGALTMIDIASAKDECDSADSACLLSKSRLGIQLYNVTNIVDAGSKKMIGKYLVNNFQDPNVEGVAGGGFAWRLGENGAPMNKEFEDISGELVITSAEGGSHGELRGNLNLRIGEPEVVVKDTFVAHYDQDFERRLRNVTN